MKKKSLLKPKSFNKERENPPRSVPGDAQDAAKLLDVTHQAFRCSTGEAIVSVFETPSSNPGRR